MSSRYYTRGPNIVYYHGVWRQEDERRSLFGGLDLAAFRRHLEILRGRFKFVPLDALLSRSGDLGRSGDPRRLPCLALTFDDGFDLTSCGVTDLLDEFGIRATTFVNTASVNYHRVMWQHQFCAIRALRGEALFVNELNQLSKEIGIGETIRSFSEQISVTRLWPNSRKHEYAAALWQACRMPPSDDFLAQYHPYFDWEGLREWIARGHSVGFHSNTHPFCSRLGQDDLDDELLEPARELEKKLGISLPAFAYPFGDRLPVHLESLVASAGSFSCLLGTGGFSSWGGAPNTLERAEPERGIDIEVFGRPIAHALRGMGRNVKDAKHRG